VFGLRRNNQPIADFKDLKLRSADSLFVVGPWSRIHQLEQKTHDFVVTELPSEHAEIVPSYRRMPVALTILVSMVLLTVFDILPLVPTLMMAALAAIFTRCLTMEDAYRAISWSSLVLVAGMLPLADALDKSGGTQLVVDALMNMMGDSGRYKFMDFVKVGVPLLLLTYVVTLIVVPMIFPFHPS
jgi:di/tricarboxylate transporter